MAINRTQRLKIYQSRLHVFITLLIVMIPFIFFLTFSRFVHIATETLFLDLLTSTGRLAVSYVIAAILAWSFAVAFYRGRKALLIIPMFDVLQSVPVFAILPMAVFFWGSSNATIVFFLILAVIWPIFFSIISSLKLIKRDWQEAVDMAGLSGFNYLRFFLLPITIPGLITGSIIGLGEGWEALVATELIVKIKPGLGSFFEIFSHSVPITAFGILGFLIFIFSINKILWLPLLEWSHRKMEE